MRRFNDFAISDLIGFILVLFIVTGSISTILLIAVPFMDDQRAIIRQESARLQLDPLNDMINDIFKSGVGGTSSMTFKTDSGTMWVDTVSSRFVIYYPVIKYQDLAQRFLFNISNFDFDHDPYSFTINIELAATNQFDFRIVDAFDEDNSANSLDHTINLDEDYDVTWGADPNLDNGAIRIDIFKDSDDYGRIWIFDVGSLNYETSSSSKNYKVKLENGGIISSTSDGGYFYTEPINWVQELLNGSKICSLKLTRIQSDNKLGSSSVGVGGSTELEIFSEANMSNISGLEKIIFLPEKDKESCIKIRIYGDTTTVNVWKNYFIDTLGFSDLGDNQLTLYEKPATYFSLNYRLLKIGLEVV